MSGIQFLHVYSRFSPEFPRNQLFLSASVYVHPNFLYISSSPPVESLLMRYSNLGLIAIVAVKSGCGSKKAVSEPSILTVEASKTLSIKPDVSIHPVVESRSKAASIVPEPDLPVREGQAYIAAEIVPRFLRVLEDSAATADRVTAVTLACQALPGVRGNPDVSAELTELRD